MIPGFRRSLARRIGRTITAGAIIAIVGQAGALSMTNAVTRPVIGAEPTPAVGSAAQDLAAPAPGGVATTIRTAAADPNVLGPADPAVDATDGSAGLAPSIQYEQAEQHAADRTAFPVGSRVAVPFEPRPGDAWPVGGSRPSALPAGRLDGRVINAQGAPETRPRGSRTPSTIPRGGGVSVSHAIAVGIDEPADAAARPAIGATVASFRAAAGSNAAEPTISPGAAISQAGLRREIFGFLPYWELNSSSLRLDYAKISTIAYFGVGADGAGNLQKRNADGSTAVGWSGWTSSKMTSVISAAHAGHTRVVLTVQSFGWNATGLARQRQLLGSATARLNLARQVAAAVRDRGADGVNLDFEPLAATYDAEFTALVRSIRTELNRVHSGYQITFDTLGSIGNYPIAAATAPGGADAVFVMGYDYRTAGSSPVGSVAPLNRTGYDVRDTVAAYTAVIPASKVILGVPYYGRAWSTSSSALDAANTSSTKTGASTTVVYDTAADYLAKYGRRYDATEGVAWTAYRRQNCTSTYGCVTSWRQLYVDDAAALGVKYDLVNQYALRGAGIWALGYDGSRPELYATIQRKFISDTTAPTSGVKTLAANQVNPAFGVAWTGRDDVAVASYDVQVARDGGAWEPWLSATKSISATWSGVDGHMYAFRARARDLKGNVGPWNVTATSADGGSGLAVGGFGVVRVDGLSIRSAAHTSAAKLGMYAVGSIVAIVGGPRSADGYTWYQVRGPLREWGVVSALPAAAWIATSGGGSTLVSPAKAPNTTRVHAVIGGLAFGNAGSASIGSGSSATVHRALSPNGDGSGDTLAIDWTNVRALDSLVLRVFRADGSLVGNAALGQRSAGAHHIEWNGRVGTTILPSGRYLVALVATAAGTTYANPGSVFQPTVFTTFAVTIDTVAPVVSSASVSSALISPNADGIRDIVTVKLSATGADRWIFSAAPISGTSVGAVVTTSAGIGRSATVTWQGRSNAGARVTDGSYRLTLTALDAAGNRAVRSWIVRVDTTAAAVTLGASPALFSPDGDRTADTTRLAWHATEAITGTARIYHGATLIRSWTVTVAASGAVTWTGTDAAGRMVADGHYAFRVSGRDAAGNLATVSSPVTVDRSLAAVHWSRLAFYPQDGDALVPNAAIVFSLKRSASVTVGIYAGTTLIRTIWIDRAMTAGTHSWTWDGRDVHGAFVARGTYSARVSVRSGLATTVVTRPVVVDAFRVSLSAAVVHAGQSLTVIVTTTEPLRAAPSISFTQPGRTAVVRTAISLGGGRYRVTFAAASGRAGTASLRISGRDAAGGLNVTTRSVTIR